MKFENLMYNGKNIKVIVELEDCFIENNDDGYTLEEDSDTLDLTNIANNIHQEEEDYNV